MTHRLILQVDETLSGVSNSVLAAWKGVAGRHMEAKELDKLSGDERAAYERVRKMITPGNGPVLASVLASGRIKHLDLSSEPRTLLAHLDLITTMPLARGLDRHALIDQLVRQIAGFRSTVAEDTTMETILVTRAEALASIASQSRTTGRIRRSSASSRHPGEVARVLVERLEELYRESQEAGSDVPLKKLVRPVTKPLAKKPTKQPLGTAILNGLKGLLGQSEEGEKG